MLVTLVLLGAAYAAVNLKAPTATADRGRDRLQSIASDSLVLLAGLNNSNGTLLDVGLTESIHCLANETAAGSMCATNNRSSTLTFRLESYLPTGIHYAFYLDNGVEERILYRKGVPDGEVVAASHSFVPNWNLTFITTELSCYEATQDVNATLYGIRHGSLVNLTSATVNGVAAVRAANGTWNATFPSVSRLAADTLTPVAIGKWASFPGTTSYDSCNLGGNGAAIVTALRATQLDIATPNVSLGSIAQFSANLAGLAAVPGVTLGASNLTIYEPVTPRNASDGYAVAAIFPLAGSTPSANWSVPMSSIYGTHPVVLRAPLSVNGATVEARLSGMVNVTLASGAAAIEAPYRATLQAWFPDWR